MKQFVEF